MAAGRSPSGDALEQTTAGRGASDGIAFRRPILRLGAVAVLVALGLATPASALTITGGPTYTLPGGGTCVVSGTAASAASGGTWTCSGVNTSAHTHVYFGMKVDANANGNTMTGATPTGANVFTSVAGTTASSITYGGSTTSVADQINGPQPVTNQLVLSIGGTNPGTVVATGGIPAGNANGVIGNLFSLPTGLGAASFTVTAKINASAPTFANGPALTNYDNTHTPAAGASDVSKVDLAFYYSDCGDGFVDSPEQCDDGVNNGTAGSCCSTSCTFKSNGTACTDDGNVCTNDTCNGASSICQHPNNTAPCNDGLFCNGADTCSGGACAAHGGDPCTGGPVCNNVCNEGADNCLVTAGTACTADSNPCTLDQCDGSGTCAHPAGNAGAVCRAGSGDLCDPDELCDGSSTSCPADVVAAIGTVCNPGSGDACDPDEVCSGVAGQACPADGFQPITTVCRPGSGDVCDPDEHCPGVPDAGCPADLVEPSGFVCNPGSGDICDPDETCSGVAGQACPNDSVAGAFVVCRPGSGDICDTDEYCTGVADQACPTDVVASNSTVCRPGSGDSCDPDELCTGTAGQACPANVVASAGTVCRAGSGDICDPDETCSGVAGQACPSDSVTGAFVVCRPAAGDCDVAENCTGTAGQACPADARRPSGYTCRSATGDCDVADTCDGTTVDCPADSVAGAFVVCRAAAGDCDLAENCDGTNKVCPTDLKSTAVCRPAAGDCDVAESCNGTSDTCPADGLAPATTVCRPSTDVCDAAEYCTGSSASCPADTGLVDTDGDTVCDALDNCAGVPNTSQENADADQFGDACDPCTNIVPTVPSKTKLTLTKLLAPTGDDKLNFKGFFTAVPGSPTIDPIGNGLRVLVTDSMGNTPIDITIPAGAYVPANFAGWKVNGSGTAWTYKNNGSVVTPTNGITKASLKSYASTPGKYKFVVKGKNGNYVVNTANLPLRGTLVIDVPTATTGQCGETAFGSGSCVAVGGGKTVKCK